MTAFAPRSLEYLNESSFGDSTNTTMTARIPVIDWKFTPQWERIPDESIMTRQNDARPPVLGPREGELEFTCYIPGGNAVPSTSLSESWFADLLGNAIGTTVLLNSDDTISTGSGVASIVTTAVTVADGSMFPIGVRGTRAGGRFIVVGSTGSGTTHASLVAVPIAPTNGDQAWDAINVYPTETASVSQAFLIQWGATGAAWYLHGAFCTGISFSLPVGKPATATFKYKCAVVTGPTTATFPSVATLSDCRHGPTMNGLCFYQTHGTTTHATVAPSEVMLELDLGTFEKRTTSGSGQYQTITGWERTRCVPTLTLKFPAWENTYNTLFALDGTSGTVYKHFYFQNNCDATGRRFGFYMPRMFQTNPEPFVDDAGGVIGTSVSFRGIENISPEADTDLMKSAIRFAFA